LARQAGLAWNAAPAHLPNKGSTFHNATRQGGRSDAVPLPQEVMMATKNIAIACQGGGSHAAFTGGVLPQLLREFDNLGMARSGHRLAYHEAGTDPGFDTPVLVAISGTSGGAISALLGWYGFITGGADEAERRLDAFWDSNSATRWAESGLNHLARALSDMASMWGWDVKASPYGFLLSGFELFNTSAWPAIAHGLGQDNPWMRADYFSLPELLLPCVDWPLVAALGDLASIPLEVRRWVRSDLQAAMFPPDAPCQARYRADRAGIEERIRYRVEAAQRLQARMDELDIGEHTLLRAAFGRWKAPPLRFDRTSLAALTKAVQAVTQCLPQLLIGAVELHQGDFVAFSSERSADDSGISLDAVLASASVPWLFRAHEMKGTDQQTLAPRDMVLWDGLFSQNPPVKDFLSGVIDDDKKPDEIWVVQINPTQAKAETVAATATPALTPALAPVAPPAASGAPKAGRLDMSGGEIWDLRNALAGNLALNQELAFVEAVNRRMEEAAPEQGDGEADDMAGVAARRRDKLVQVERIIMDSDAVEATTGTTLGANSKFDRDPRLKEALCEHGRLQARRYLALRRQVGRLCGALGSTLAGACSSASGIDPASADGALCRATAGGALVIDGSTVYSMRSGDPAAPQALVRWRTLDAQLDGRPVRIEGESELADDMNNGAEWRLKDVRITAVVPKKEKPPTLPLAAQPQLEPPAKPQAKPQARARPARQPARGGGERPQ
jgi:predicted acylesterase/phospholipase RssA